MTDYYVIGAGHTAYGPYNLSDAKSCAQALAHKYDGEKTIEIVGTAETAYSRLYDDLPPEPPEDAPRPWEGMTA